MHIRSSIIVQFLCYLARAIPLNPKAHLTPTNLTYNDHAHCINTEDWAGDGYVDAHCAAAIANLYHSDVFEHSSTPFEFLAPGARSVYGIPAVWTPRRYTVGTCTVMIAMRVTFPYKMLPGEQPRRPYGWSDVSNFARLLSVAKEIEFQCLRADQSLGWAMDGDLNHGIGVFIWSTRSRMNRFVRGSSMEASNMTNDAPSSRLAFEIGNMDNAGMDA